VIVAQKETHSVIVDVRTGKEEMSFAQQDPARCALSPDGKLAATAGWSDVVSDGWVRGIYELVMWNTVDGKRQWRVASPGWLAGRDLEAGWSADGKTVSWKRLARPGAATRGPTAFDLSELQFVRPLLARNLRGPTLSKGPLSLKQLDDTTIEVLRGGKHHAEIKLPPGTHIRTYLVKHSLALVGKDRASVLHGGYSALVFDVNTGKLVHTLGHSHIPYSAAGSPDGRYLLTLATDQILRIWNMETGKVVLALFVSGQDWIAWAPGGRYAASPGGEKLMGWILDKGIDREPAYLPAERLHKQLYRPDVIKLLLEKGNVKDALSAANEALRKQGIPVREEAADLEILLPPTVKLAVVDRSKLPDVKLRVDAVAGAKEQPIVALRLLVDGRPLPAGVGVNEYREGKQKDTVEWTVALPSGTHHLAVLARSADASAVSNEIEIDCREAAEKPILHVLAVGVDRYQSEGLNLKCAANDARTLAAAFKKGCQGDVFPEVRTSVLLDREATRPGILKAIEALRGDEKKKVKDNDLLVVFFAGHGVTRKNQFFLLTTEADLDDLDGTALSGGKLREALGAFPCQVLLVMDACHSGAFGGTGKLTQKEFKPGTDDAARSLADSEVGVAVMCAAMGYERSEERDGNGLFTRALIQALSDSDVPHNKINHKQYIHHLQTFVFDRVSEESQEKQHPFLHMPWTMESFALRKLSVPKE
jgi:hypothetical protein